MVSVVMLVIYAFRTIYMHRLNIASTNRTCCLSNAFCTHTTTLQAQSKPHAYTSRREFPLLRMPSLCITIIGGPSSLPIEMDIEKLFYVSKTVDETKITCLWTAFRVRCAPLARLHVERLVWGGPTWSWWLRLPRKIGSAHMHDILA
jgi:hypothetical protein